MPDKPKIHRSEIIAESRLFRVQQLDLEFSNGEKRVFERLVTGMRGAVLIIPVMNQQEFLLIREYAAGTERYELGFPKGLVEAHETSVEAANRELQEEAGYAAKKLTVLKNVTLAPGYLSHRMDIVLAEDLYPSRLPGDEPEPIELELWRFDQIDELLQQPLFSEARSIAALFLAQKYLGTL